MNEWGLIKRKCPISLNGWQLLLLFLHSFFFLLCFIGVKQRGERVEHEKGRRNWAPNKTENSKHREVKWTTTIHLFKYVIYSQFHPYDPSLSVSRLQTQTHRKRGEREKKPARHTYTNEDETRYTQYKCGELRKFTTFKQCAKFNTTRSSHVKNAKQSVSLTRLVTRAQFPECVAVHTCNFFLILHFFFFCRFVSVFPFLSYFSFFHSLFHTYARVCWLLFDGAFLAYTISEGKICSRALLRCLLRYFACMQRRWFAHTLIIHSLTTQRIFGCTLHSRSTVDAADACGYTKEMTKDTSLRYCKPSNKMRHFVYTICDFGCALCDSRHAKRDPVSGQKKCVHLNTHKSIALPPALFFTFNLWAL